MKQIVVYTLLQPKSTKVINWSLHGWGVPLQRKGGGGKSIFAVVLTWELEVSSILKAGGGGAKRFHPLIGGGGGGHTQFYPVLRGDGRESVRPAIFKFCSPSPPHN